jgi:class 3 adenylate cyclase
LILVAVDLAKRIDQITEGGSVLVEKHLAAMLGQVAQAIEAEDRRLDPFALQPPDLQARSGCR